MKKLGLLFLSVLICAGFTACSDDDNNNTPVVTETLSGFYTLDGGNKSGKIPAEMTAYDFATGVSNTGAFEAANGIGIGDGAQQALVYKDKMFIVMYGSDLIWVVEPETLKVIASIHPQGEATLPRFICENNGKLYCSMYTGYVSEIDPESLTITRSVKVGPNPDQLASWGDNLVVCCSDGQNSKGTATNGVKYGNSCVSIVNVKSFTEIAQLKDLDLLLNPTDVVSNGSDVFVVAKGTYGKPTDAGFVPNKVVKITGTSLESAKYVCDGTNIAINGKNLYVIYAQSGQPLSDITYKRYNADTFQETGVIADQTSSADAKIDYPNGVFVDPVSGDIVMLSYTLDASGAAQYRMPCYANVYDGAGQFQTRVTCGVGARYVTFIHEQIK